MCAYILETLHCGLFFPNFVLQSQELYLSTRDILYTRKS